MNSRFQRTVKCAPILFLICLLVIPVVLSYGSRRLSVSAAQQSLAPTEGLLVYYNFENGGKDAAGNIDLPITDGSRLVPGKVGTALDFGGIGDAVTTPLTGTLYDGANGMTVALWVKIDGGENADNGGNSNIIGWDSAWAHMFVQNGTGNLGMHMSVEYPYAWNNNADRVGESKVYVFDQGEHLGTWNHVAFVSEPSGVVTVYINGVAYEGQWANNTNFADYLPPIKGDITLGAWGKGAMDTTGFLGQMDEIRIYDRPLSRAEIAALMAYDGTSFTPLTEGSGTVSDPYRISTKEDLVSLPYYPNAHFILMNDIVFTDGDFSAGGDWYGDGQGWQPIGSPSRPFSGIFDGDGHTVSGLRVDRTEVGNVYGGLFGYVTGTVKDLTLTDAKVSVTSTGRTVYAGILAGYSSGIIENCHVTDTCRLEAEGHSLSLAGGIVGHSFGQVTSCTSAATCEGDGYVGGIAGSVHGGRIESCQSHASVSGDTVGGIVGYLFGNGHVSLSHNDGTLTANTAAGGIVGVLEGGSHLSRCYSLSTHTDPSGNSSVISGGIVGQAAGSRRSYIIDSFYTGPLAGGTAGGILGEGGMVELRRCYYAEIGADLSGGSAAGAMVGRVDRYDVLLTDCYYMSRRIAAVGEGTASGEALPLRFGDLLHKTSFIGWDFDNVWQIPPAGEPYRFPVLRDTEAPELMTQNIIEFAGGLGTEDSPYLIATKAQLDRVRHYPDAHFRLIQTQTFTEADFALGGDFYNAGQGWLPLFGGSESFSGVFDGGGHVINGLTVRVSATANVRAGLFGTVTGTVKDLGLANASVSMTSTGGSFLYAGLIAGYLDGGSLLRCYATGSLTISAPNTGTLYVGGLLGRVKGTVTRAYHVGDIHVTAPGTVYVGGIVGHLRAVSSVSQVYHVGTATTSGTATVGGIVGFSQGTVTDAYCENSFTRGVGSGTDSVTRCPAASMTAMNGYPAFDFIREWNLAPDASFPYPTIRRSPALLSSLSVTTPPNQLVYEWSTVTAPNLTGGILTLIYDNGATETVPLSDTTVTGFDGQQVGEQTLTICYGGKTTTFTVTVKKKILTAIVVTAKPDKTSYLEGKDDLNLTGGKITLSYDNNTTEEIALSEANVTGFDNTKIGQQTLTVTYGGKAATFTVTVKAKTLTSIAVTTKPDKTLYLVDRDDLDLTGGRITLIYDNDTTKEIALSEANVTGFDNARIGQQTLTVTYQGKSTTLKITVNNRTLASIAVTTDPAKTTYLEGKDALDLTGGKITLTYDNGTTEEIDLADANVAGFDNTKVGQQALTVTYSGKSATLTVTVKAKSLATIAVTTLPIKTSYLEAKEALHLTGGKITLTYDNGTTEEIDLSEATVTGFDNTKVGQQTLTVTYGGKAATFPITVKAKSLSSISVTARPTKTSYLEGKDKLDLTGGKITLTYDNGTTEEIDLSEATVTDFDNTKVGQQILTARYQGKTDTFRVTVKAKSLSYISITANPTKTSYLEGKDALDLSGGKLTLVYDNGTTEEIDLSEATVTGFDNAKIGKQTLTVKYQGETATFTITVLRRIPTAITSKVYRVTEAELRKIPLETAVVKLLDGIPEKAFLKVFKDKTEVTGQTPVGTGMIISIMDGSTVAKSYTVVVTGDINGDGKISITDFVQMKSHLLKKTTLIGCYAKAADTNGDGNVSVTDFVQLKGHLLKKMEIQAN